MTKEYYRKPTPSPPKWYWWESDNCWDCPNRNNCNNCSKMKKIRQQERAKRKRELKANLKKLY